MSLPKFTGIITAASARTLKVEVSRIVKISPYEKRIRRKKSYFVADPQGNHRVGQTITFQPSRPMSRKKRFIVIT